MERKLNNKGKLFLIGILGIGIVILSVVFFNLKQPIIEFKEDKVEVEIHGTYDAVDYVKKVKGYDVKDVDIDSSSVRVDEIGSYQIIYKINNEEYILELDIVDKIPPTYETIALESALGVPIIPDSLVKNIKDDTKTTVFFKEDYKFDKEGEYKVIVVVEDQGKNKVEKETTIKLIKDTEKPTLSDLKNYTVIIGDKIDYLKGIIAKDNLDKNPKVDVDSSQVNLSKIGTYEVKYNITDASHNSNTYIQKVTVHEKKPVVNIPANGSKIVYLTFDDGPSSNTAKVLEILNKYNAKATFFVTGNGQKYNYLIKSAHDKGHTIALHTYSHKYNKLYASVDAYFDDLDKVGNMVKNIIGYVPKYIRFPGGSSNVVSRSYTKGIMSTLVSEVQRRGYQYYDWNASSGDAGGNNVPVTNIVKESTSSRANNIVLLFHDSQSKNTTVQALPQIIEYYQSRGYVFKAIDDNSFTAHHGVNN